MRAAMTRDVDMLRTLIVALGLAGSGRTPFCVLVLSVAFGAFLAGTARAGGGMLIPSDYAPLAPSLTESGTYVVSDYGLTLPDGSTIATTVDGVFTFGSIDIQSATFRVDSTLPFVLLSQSDLTIVDGNINVSAGGSNPGSGGNGGGRGGENFPAAGGGGGLGTQGEAGGAYQYLGIPLFTPRYGDYVPGGAGGAAVGGLQNPLVGGGLGGSSPMWGGVGGAGGGAVELGASRALTFGGFLSSNGGDASGFAAGGGSGGSIAIYGHSVDLSGATISARGGLGTPGFIYGGVAGAAVGNGGDGGLGCLNIETYQLISPGSVSGVLLEVNSIPEPSSFVTLTLGITCVLLTLRTRRRKWRVRSAPWLRLSQRAR